MNTIKSLLLVGFAAAMLSACGGGGGPNLSYWKKACKNAAQNGGTWTDPETGATVTAAECNNTWFNKNGDPCGLIDPNEAGLPGALPNGLGIACKWKVTGDKVRLSEDPGWPLVTNFQVTEVTDTYCEERDPDTGVCLDWETRTYIYWTSNFTSLKYEYPNGNCVNKSGAANRKTNDIFALAEKEDKLMIKQKAADLAMAGIPEATAKHIAKRIVLETQVKGTYTDTQMIEMEALNLAGVPRDVTAAIIRDAKAGNMSGAMSGVTKAAEAAAKHFNMPEDRMMKIIMDQVN